MQFSQNVYFVICKQFTELDFLNLFPFWRFGGTFKPIFFFFFFFFFLIFRYFENQKQMEFAG